MVAFEIDHIIVCAPGGRRDSACLIERGFQCGAERVHVGQGTANACFYFDNAYLELLWLNEEAETRSPVVAPLSLWERTQWRDTGACPFGVALRSTNAASNWPGATWNYHAPYFSSGASIPIVTPRHEWTAPLVFLMSGFALGPPAELPIEHRPILIHRGRRYRVIGVEISMPHLELPPEFRIIDELAPVKFAAGADYHLTLRLGSTGIAEVIDFRPTLPLTAIAAGK